MRVQLVTRVGCHLCEEAEAALVERGIAFELLDVDQDDALFGRYDFRVPVILVNGEVVAEGRVSFGLVDRVLAFENRD